MKLSPVPPGPKGHFLVGSLPEIQRDELDFLMRQVHEHGDVVHVRVVNHHAYVLSHPRDIETVLVSKSSNFIKSVFLRESKALFGDGLLTSDGGLWQRQRRALQPAFHHDHVLSYTRTMADSTARMLATWQDGEERDVHQDMTRLTMEIVAKVLFGEEISSDAEQACEAFGLFFQQYDERFGLYLIPEWLPTPENIRYRRSIKRLDEIVLRIIRCKVASANGNGHAPDVLSILLSAAEGKGAGMAERQVRDEMMTLFFTGHETTALALAWTFYLLGQNPEAEKKLQAEVDAVLGGRAPNFQDLARMPFLEMVFKESLRLYPPAFGVVREAVNDCEIGGYPIPKGATLAMFQWVVHRDPRFFNRPEEFIPERWEKDFAKTLPRCAYFPFGAGPRLCIGNTFAQAEVPMILAAIVQKFQLKLVPGHRVATAPSLTLRPLKGIRVTLKKR
ncbi:MAG: cytochrome P450 [Terriglobia bacterium]|jgi:cytochrome P450